MSRLFSFESFGNPRQFADFLNFARASACETKSLLRKGLAVGYFTADDVSRLDALANRGLQALAKFQRYLRSPEAERNARRRYSGPRKATHPENSNDPNENDPNEPNGSNDSNDSNDSNVGC